MHVHADAPHDCLICFAHSPLIASARKLDLTSLLRTTTCKSQKFNNIKFTNSLRKYTNSSVKPLGALKSEGPRPTNLWALSLKWDFFIYFLNYVHHSINEKRVKATKSLT